LASIRSIVEQGDLDAFEGISRGEALRRFGSPEGLEYLHGLVAGKVLKVRDPEFVSRYYMRPARHDDWDEFHIQLHEYEFEVSDKRRGQLLFTAAVECIAKYQKEPLPPGKNYEYHLCHLTRIRPAACGVWAAPETLVQAEFGASAKVRDLAEEIDRDEQWRETGFGQRTVEFNQFVYTGTQPIGTMRFRCAYDDENPCRPKCEILRRRVDPY
jgi:hypothetical protein